MKGSKQDKTKKIFCFLFSRHVSCVNYESVIGTRGIFLGFIQIIARMDNRKISKNIQT